MAAGFGADVYVVGHDVRRFAAADDADVARAVAFLLRDKPMPAALDQIGDGERRDGDRAHAFFRPVACMAREAFDIDRHPIAAGRADFQRVGGAAVEVERQAVACRVSRVAT